MSLRKHERIVVISSALIDNGPYTRIVASRTVGLARQVVRERRERLLVVFVAVFVAVVEEVVLL
ncbi:hypothetical protein D8S78_14570 [Natrialba swarupiae]|nr:hypothetical protein [Natrialba swarupiae]